MKVENTPVKPTQDERIMAALAHASILLPFWGLIGAIVIWVTQREKSQFVRFQALQGTLLQVILILSWFTGGACYACSFFGMFPLIPLGATATEGTETGAIGGLLAMLIFFIPFLIMGLTMLLGLAFIVYGIYGAVRVLQGRDFHYAVIGRKLEKYLNQESPTT
jgi:uncharacterized Tic20 family protein